mmetsp:Transcript_2389/g.5115  ORF Transcript_2389/g.5115 Transcript_2389/m.5115 type:complete len:508 (+) Transcript_2389:83-1606(+)
MSNSTYATAFNRSETPIFASIETRLKEHLDRRTHEGSLRSLMPLPASADADTSSKKNPLTLQSALVDFASNDYLGLARCSDQHSKVESAYREFLSRYEGSKTNPPVLGATGSRLLSGDSSLARTLEAYLASPSVHDREAALIFNSGYDANLSILSSLPYRNENGSDAIIVDELVHNSLVMGVRMSRLDPKNVFLFRHNDVEDMKRVLKNVCQLSKKSTSAIASSGPSVLIVVESVYSMDGDIAPIKRILDSAYEMGATVMIDEAHGLGVFGRTNSQNMILEDGTDVFSKINSIDKPYKNENTRKSGGTGVLGALNLEHHPALFCSVHTFGKAAGCHGAVVAGSSNLISYLVNYARPFVYSTALPPHSLVTIHESYESMLGIEGERRRKRVFQLVKLFRQKMLAGLCELKDKAPSLEFELLPSPSPIQAVIVPGNERCISICNYLRNSGKLDVYPIRSPTVAKGKERIRIILHSHNDEKEVHYLVESLSKILKQSILHQNLDMQVSKL